MDDLNFLETTRANEISLNKKSFSTNGLDFLIHKTGILEVVPKNSSSTCLIISCGIHGNETAPIEFCDTILNKIFNGSLSVAHPTLFIFGNPRAMNEGKRFSQYNLNRCFNEAYLNIEECYEKNRAKDIEENCHAFRNKYQDLELIHLDLHCALKPSVYEKFALVPQGKKSTNEVLLNSICSAMEIEAMLVSETTSSVFSSFSFNKLGATSATIELGKVYPFGMNPEGKFQSAQDTVEALISDSSLVEKSKPKIFEIYEIVNKEHSDFSFTFVEEQSSNFTEFKKGEHIFTQGGHEYKVREDGISMVFPNSKVILGQRALLLIKELEN